jgi:hypothetical protein
VKHNERSLEILHIREPNLEFAHAQTTTHPKDGLFLFGPYNSKQKPKEVRLGVIGTQKGIDYFKKWAERLKHRVEVPPPGKGEKQDRLHLANFPGIEEALGVTFDLGAFVTYPIDPKEIDAATRILNLHEAVSKVAKLFVSKAKRHFTHEERTVDLWMLVIPEIVFERCRPGSKRVGLPMEKGDFGRKQKKRSDLPLFSQFIDHESEAIFEDAPDFHRHVKAEFLTITPTQLIRETTIAPEEFKNNAGQPLRRTQDRATVAWNLATGLYYKTQPLPPWRLSGVRSGVCYVGLVYKNLPNDPNNHACCAAQMFLHEGDGVVFRGANGPWKTSEFEYHLRPDAARDLIKMVLDTYKQKHGKPPRELFIHGQTYFNDDEWGAFAEAAPKRTNVVGVRIRTTGGETKLFRDGDYPVLRGTAMILNERNAYLWTNGYLPQLNTYIGPETPNPLFITILRSKAKMPEIGRILKDIMGLTKINYNSCNFNDGLPVTVRFARMVGEVLTMGAAKGAERQPFKFYV